MARSLDGQTCRNCMRLFQEATLRGDVAGGMKYANPGTYRKVSEASGGFSYSKAIVGMAVFGGIGAVAGINGKKAVTYRCSVCGNTVTQEE